LWKCIRVKYAPCYVRKGPQLTQKHTRARRRRQHREWIQCLVRQTIGKQRHVTKLECYHLFEISLKFFCFPFRSRNVNVCRVSDFWACNIYFPMRETWITVLSCRSQNISQKGRNRLRRSKKVYKHRVCRHRHTRDSQGWQHCVVIPLAKHLAGTTGKVEKVKACVVRRQGTEEGRTKVR
jgi:hypothetical protein